jgi:hypothetical protein
VCLCILVKYTDKTDVEMEKKVFCLQEREEEEATVGGVKR